MKIQRVLVPGGAGYIGSHTCVALIEAGYEVICADNFCNSSPKALDRIEEITGIRPALHNVDFCDIDQVDELFAKESIDAAIHFAGHKAVGESVEKPLMYYENNLLSLINLCKAMEKGPGKNIVFSSSATVYGDPDQLPLTEDSSTSAHSPYGRTKLYIEEILRDVHSAMSDWNISILRYFNPVGAHKSGLIGEDPVGIPNNLMPFISQVAVGRLKELKIFGNDYPTPDGTCRRDYIHVVDLAKGHVSALKWLEKENGFTIHNLGTGTPYSVLEMVNTFAQVNSVEIPYSFAPRRDGDVPQFWASTDKARQELGWVAELGLEDMVRDSWNWQSKNPKGYA